MQATQQPQLNQGSMLLSRVAGLSCRRLVLPQGRRMATTASAPPATAGAAASAGAVACTKPLNAVFSSLPTTIFTVMSALATECKAINLGQGFPDEDGPLSIREAAAAAVVAGPNQYPPMMGLPALRQAYADHTNRHFNLGVTAADVLVTSGGTEALTCALLALLNPGDEVVLLAPCYDSYLPIVAQSGATAVVVSLEPPAIAGGPWALPETELRAAFGPKTKLVVVNSPMNPIGKVFTPAELGLLAELVVAHDCLAVCDEVYEHLTFDGRAHVPLMALPGMRMRSLRVGSAGKSLSLTGWKVGYVTAHNPGLLRAVAGAHQFCTFTTPPALQLGVAAGLGLPRDYFSGLATGLAAKRARLAAGLASAGFRCLESEGTYFLTACFAGITDSSPGVSDSSPGEWPDAAFARALTRDAGVACIPLSAFYPPPRPGEPGPPRDLVRFAFCKRDDVLDEAVARLLRWRDGRRR